jgi:hypothetical protein
MVNRLLYEKAQTYEAPFVAIVPFSCEVPIRTRFIEGFLLIME